MARNRQDLKQEIDHALALIDELGIQETGDYLGSLKREDKIRLFGISRGPQGFITL
jgi:hypothetical protein